MMALDLVTALRREIPGLGTKKLHLLLREPLQKSGISMGRDQLHELLRAHHLLIRHGRLVPKTTHSNHLLRKYPNLIKDLPLIETEQVWVCDMTYIYVGYDFNYLSLITDAYSKKIVVVGALLSTAGIRITRISEWVQYYNYQRNHESLDNCTPEQVYYNKREAKLKQTEKIKQLSLNQRRKN